MPGVGEIDALRLVHCHYTHGLSQIKMAGRLGVSNEALASHGNLGDINPQ